MVENEINLIDILLSTGYSTLIILIAFQVKSAFKDKNYSRYFIPFFSFKILFAIFFVIIHIFYYKGGDTFLYFSGSKFISNQIFAAPEKLFVYLFGTVDIFKNLAYGQHLGMLRAFNDSTTLIQSQLGAPFVIASFGNFLCTTILFSAFSGIGIWALYSTLCKLYPQLYKVFAICVLFYPTIAIWGSGLLKDPIVLASIGWIFQATYYLTERKKIMRSIFLIVISTLLCLNLKAYVLYTFIPAMLLWLQARFSNKITSSSIRFFVTPIVLASIIGGGVFFLNSVSESAGKYSLDNVQSVAEGFQDWHTYLAETRDQSGYTLGETNFTPLGILQKAPQAFFVTFYRPRPDEVRNFATAFESIQSTILLLLTVYIIFKIGGLTFLRTLFSNKEVRAFMLFAITLGIAVGITSYNFGALSRYKIPCLPFFTSSLAIIYYKGMMLKSNLKSIKK